MAFIRSVNNEPAALTQTPNSHLAALTSPDADARRRAARALAGHADAAPALAERLAAEPEPGVRNALFGSLVSIASPDVAALVAPYLRSEDAGLRGGAIEALKQLQDAAIAAVDELLSDPDPDLRLLAIEVTRAWPRERAASRLRRILEEDQHVNVCAAAVDVATEAGDAELLPALVALRLRFCDEMFLIFAVDVACNRIGNPEASGA